MLTMRAGLPAAGVPFMRGPQAAGFGSFQPGRVPGVGECQPATTNQPVTITGGGVDFHPDYLSLVFKWQKRPDMGITILLAGVAHALLGEADAGIFQLSGMKSRRHGDIWRGPYGIDVAAFEGDDGECGALLNVRGEGCEHVGLVEFRNLIDWAFTNGVCPSCTRLDLAWDGLAFSVDEAIAARDRGDIRTKGREWQVLKSRGSEREGESTTLYVGSGASDRMVRLYDEHGFVRLELQLRRERAWAALADLLWVSGQSPRDLTEAEPLARGILVDFLNFVDQASDSNITRRRLLPWWSAFVGGVAKLRHLLPRVQKSLERSVAWVKKTVAPTIAVCMASAMRAGESIDSWAASIFEEGSRRWNAWQRVLVRGELLPAVAGVSDGRAPSGVREHQPPSRAVRRA